MYPNCMFFTITALNKYFRIVDYTQSCTFISDQLKNINYNNRLILILLKKFFIKFKKLKYFFSRLFSTF